MLLPVTEGARAVGALGVSAVTCYASGAQQLFACMYDEQ